MTTGFGFCATCGTPRGSADVKFCATCGAAFASAAPPLPLETAPAALGVETPPVVTPAPPASQQLPVAPPPAPQFPQAYAPPPPLAQPAYPPPPGPQYPQAYDSAPSPSYSGQPGYAASGVQAASGVAAGAGGGILRGILMLPVALFSHLVGKILVTLFSILMVVALIVSYLGVVQVPVLSSAFGMDHARDLGMTRDKAALDAFCAKWGIHELSPAADYTLGNKHHYSGSVQVDDTISETALAALPEYNAPNSHVSQIQFRIHEGYAEVSAFVNVPGYPASGPMYAEFSIAATSSQTVALDFSHLDFGRAGVPSNVIETVKTDLDGYLNDKIVEAGVKIQTLELHEGAIRFKGTWPAIITADPGH